MRATKATATAAIALTALLALTACGGSSSGTSSSGTSSSGSSSGAATSSAPASSSDAGNGIADKSADEILKAAQAAAKAQTSVHLKGTVKQGAESLALDLSLAKDGSATGSIGMTGATIQIISNGTQVWIKADAAFWEKNAGAGAGTLFADKWITGGATGGTSGFESLTDFTQMVDNVLKPTGTLTKVDPTTVDGVAVVGLKDGKTGTLWIATSGDPLPVRIDGGTEGTIAFSEWGDPVTIATPAASDVIDPSTLGQ